MIPVTVRLTTDPIELTRVDALAKKNTPADNGRFSIALSLVPGPLYLIGGIIKFIDERHTAIWYSSVVLCFGLALLNFVQAARVIQRSRRSARRNVLVDSEVTISDERLTLRPTDRTIPWKSVAEVRHVDAYLVFVGPDCENYAMVSDGDLPNSGRDLWAALDDRFVPKRYLVRGALSPLRIAVTCGATLPKTY